MEKEKYIPPIILEKLEENFANKSILENPRCSEIADIIISIAKQMGNLSQDIGSPYYENQLITRVELLLSSSGLLQFDEKGSIIIKEPQYCEDEFMKDTTHIYEALGDGKLKRTVETKENGKAKSKEESIIDKDGIEQRKVITRQGKGILVIQRTQQNPLVAELKLQQGKEDLEEFYDISHSINLQDIEIIGAKRITQDEITQIQEIDKIRAWERFKHLRYKYPFYLDGIRKMLGIQEEVEYSENIK